MPRVIAGVEVVMLVSGVKPAQDQGVAALHGPREHRPGGRATGRRRGTHAAGAQLVGTREDAKAKILPELSRLIAQLDATVAAAGPKA